MLPQTSLPPPAGARPHRARRRGGRTTAPTALLGVIAAGLLTIGAQDERAGARDAHGEARTGPPPTDASAAPASPGYGGGSGAGATVLSVTVPATTTVHLDERGQVVAVWTNTGTAPHPDDDTWVQRDGAVGLHPADAGMEARLAAMAWTGPWLPGEWHLPPAVAG